MHTGTRVNSIKSKNLEHGNTQGVHSDLWEIKESCQQIAEAVSAALSVETEIIDSNLRIIAATYLLRHIGHTEEGGKSKTDLYLAEPLQEMSTLS